MSERSITEILADCLHIERLGHPVEIPWREDAARRAAHIIRLLEKHGLQLVPTGNPALPVSAPESSTIWRSKIVGRDAERLVRFADAWQIVTIEGGAETIEQSLTIKQCLLDFDLVLTGDPAALTIKQLGRKLAAAGQIFALDAATMEPPR